MGGSEKWGVPEPLGGGVDAVSAADGSRGWGSCATIGSGACAPVGKVRGEIL